MEHVKNAGGFSCRILNLTSISRRHFGNVSIAVGCGEEPTGVIKSTMGEIHEWFKRIVILREQTMKHNGMPILTFRATALVHGSVSYVDARQYIGRSAVICFLPYASMVPIEQLDREACLFQDIDVELLIVISGTRPLHRLWLGQSHKPKATVFADLCGRLHRMFGVNPHESVPKCHTFVADKRGILCVRLTHEFIAQDLRILRRVVGWERIPAAESDEHQREGHLRPLEFVPVS